MHGSQYKWKLAAVEGDVVNGMMQAGQSLTVLQKVEPVATNH